jgi:hypothetical protein
MKAERALDRTNTIAVENGLVAFSILFFLTLFQSLSKP